MLAFTEAAAAGDLERAARVYGGELLPGSYDNWLLTARDRLRASTVEVMRQLASTTPERVDAAAALRHGRRLVELEPLDEAAHRLIMRAHRMRGERIDALRVYRQSADARPRRGA